MEPFTAIRCVSGDHANDLEQQGELGTWRDVTLFGQGFGEDLLKMETSLQQGSLNFDKNIYISEVCFIDIYFIFNMQYCDSYMKCILFLV